MILVNNFYCMLLMMVWWCGSYYVTMAAAVSSTNSNSQQQLISQSIVPVENLKIVSFVDAVKRAFFKHPLHSAKREGIPLVEYLTYLSGQAECSNKPIVVSMARVQSPLYWQLIEGFFHSMFYFDHLSCSVMICITGTVRYAL